MWIFQIQVQIQVQAGIHKNHPANIPIQIKYQSNSNTNSKLNRIPILIPNQFPILISKKKYETQSGMFFYFYLNNYL